MEKDTSKPSKTSPEETFRPASIKEFPALQEHLSSSTKGFHKDFRRRGKSTPRSSKRDPLLMPAVFKD